MAMPRIKHDLLALFRPRSDDMDGVLDLWIRDALREEAVAQPSQGAWERLRSALERHRTRRYGMWVLDEVLRDPPESLPTPLSQAQYRRAGRLYAGYPGWALSNTIFSHPMLVFPVIFNL